MWLADWIGLDWTGVTYRRASVPHSGMPSGKSSFCAFFARSTSYRSGELDW